MPSCTVHTEPNAWSLHAVLHRDLSDERLGEGCRIQSWDSMLELVQKPLSSKNYATAKDKITLEAPNRPEEDFGVTLCLPNFSRVAETVPARLCVEKMNGIVRRASVALSYSKDLVRVQRDLARDRVCSIFCKQRSVDEIEKAELMRILADAIKSGSVVLVSQEQV